MTKWNLCVVAMLSLSGAFVAPCVANARLGETEDELTTRFGQPADVMQQRPGKMWLLSPAQKVLKFNTKEYVVSVYLMDGQSAVEAYTYPTDFSGPNDSRVQNVLKANVANGSQWVLIPNPEAVNETYKFLWVQEAGDESASAIICADNLKHIELRTKRFTDLRKQK